MSRVWIKDIAKHDGQIVELKGWINSRRDHGKLIFIDLRDRSGLLQVVFWGGGDKSLFERATKLRSEFVVAIKGTVQKRNKDQVNEDLPETGAYELAVTEFTILNEAETPVFEIDKANQVNEELRMQYRYLDLRSVRMTDNIKKRYEIVKLIRNELDSEHLWEIETPYLTKGTPEGAREFIVPARLSPGMFYALPQSPQQFKQLLMVGGMDRYFQIARCFRDEDTRGDRQAEFTQVDMELSFVDREDVMKLNENLLIKIVTELYPEKTIQQTPFPRISYKEAMRKYGTDRPDLRDDKTNDSLLAFCWVVDFPMFEKTETDAWTFTHNPFSSTLPEFEEQLLTRKDLGKVIASQFDIVLNGYEIGGGSMRNHKPKYLEAVLSIIGYSKEEINNNFGHILSAFKYGTPPHGGIAWGLERLIMILQNEPSIRDVMAFPKTGDSKDILMGAPSSLPANMLEEAGDYPLTASKVT